MAEAEYPNDFYALLGVERDADIAAIRGAFRRVSLEEHPDKAGNTPEAHERRAYDGQAGFDWPVPDIVFDNLFEGRAAFREQVENFKKQRNNLFAKKPTQAELPTELVYADIYHQIDEHLASVRAVSQSLGIIRDQVTGIIPLTNHELWTAMASKRYDSASFEECFRILDVVKSAFELAALYREHR
ncbi:putative dnaj-like subfamily c member 10-like protein [Eutypa lata UCREL1]|uniref:Putative dnaj-like subfamily c member 10-like protein n=1 Tax=Eutypa lata (strain UCR-EL1) TaxID=1287681 RepID=M7T699_EUTLA|nr:putative dnaj-like subfamily c member 10-like protein [Eutypa lata UCREL1]